VNLRLTTQSSNLYGIIGKYADESGNELMLTLEHAYASGVNSWSPKLARGKTYTCKRGVWTLESGLVVKTFQVMDVPDFQGSPVRDLLAAHPGNYNTSSKGCVCVGTYMGVGCILDSDIAFEKFKTLQAGCDAFTLLVS
jgi:uncharacterized protein DUF5675